MCDHTRVETIIYLFIVYYDDILHRVLSFLLWFGLVCYKIFQFV